MQSIGIFSTPGKERVPALLQQLIALAEAGGISLLIDSANAIAIRREDLAADEDTLARCDAIIVLGGDGAVLGAARAAAPYRTPVLAVDLGRLGFLSAVRPDQIEDAFDLLLRDGFEIEERMMLDAQVLRDAPRGNKETGSKADTASSIVSRTPLPLSTSPLAPQFVGGGIGLNDAVVAKSAIARILRVSIFVEGDQVAELRADGLVISTPTGSTAYALAAGGPIVHPGVPLLLVCPIAAHSLTQRPFIVGPNEVIEVRADWEGDEVSPGELEAMLTIDGQIGVILQPGDLVRVRRSEHKARLLRRPSETFYDRLRQKMSWG
jgi:NAD+ kinase